MNKLKSAWNAAVAFAKAHPVVTVLVLLFCPLILGGLTWKVIGLARKVLPQSAGDKLVNAAGDLQKKTGSA